jgi:acyl-CoA oxidase
MDLFLAGALQPHQAAAVRNGVNKLCYDLTADGGKTIWALCDGFGIPDELLFAPIAFDWKLIGTEQSAI